MAAALPRDLLSAITVRAPRGSRDLFPIKLENYDVEIRAQKSTPFLRFRYCQIEIRLDNQVTKLWLSKTDLIEHFANDLKSVRSILSYFSEFMVQLIQEEVPFCTKDRISESEMLKAIEIAQQHFNDVNFSAVRKQAVRTVLAGRGCGYLLFTKIQKQKDFCIGAGVSKQVKLAIDLFDTRIHAVSICRKEYLPDDAQWEMALNEPHMLRKLIGKFGILQIRDSLIEDKKIYIITKLMNRGDLQRFLAAGHEITIREKLSIAMQIAQGLRNMHELEIIHRDLRPENIFLSSHIVDRRRVIRAVIGDLGTACLLNQNDLLKIKTGSGGYLAPERHAAFANEEDWIRTSTPQADIWAFGLTLYSLFHTIPGTILPFQQTDQIQNLTQKMVDFQIEETKLEVYYIDNLLKKMLQIDPSKRPDAHEVYVELRNIDGFLPPEKPGAVGEA